MSTRSFRFKVGQYECIVVSDGTNTYHNPAPALFANAPKERLRQVLREHQLDPEQWKEHVSTYPGLVINSGDHRTLVDTGAGDLLPTTGRLIPNLQAEGIAPDDIGTVILTHAHGDHIGGNTNSEGKPAFPNAGYVMWKDEWDFWFSDTADAKASQRLVATARKKLKPVQGRLTFLDHEMEIVPGIHTIPASGHTPGHMAVVISSDDEQLLCISDAALHPIHLAQPSWYSAIDFAPEQALSSRRWLLEWAAAENALVQAFHFPFPGLGHVKQKGDAWQWQPVETMG